MGSDFLLTNLVSDIPVDIMKSIKKEAFDKYLPHDRRPIKAWGLAMASLRCLKRDLVKNKNKQLAAAAASASIAATGLTNHAFNNSREIVVNNAQQNEDITTVLLDQIMRSDYIGNASLFSSVDRRRSTIAVPSIDVLIAQVPKPVANKKRLSTTN